MVFLALVVWVLRFNSLSAGVGGYFYHPVGIGGMLRI